MHTPHRQPERVDAALQRARALADAEVCRESTWEAVRYLSGEMSTPEADSFELRLADDLDAATALADAVLLLESVQLGRSLAKLPQPLPAADSAAAVQSTSAWFRKLATVACAASLLFAGWYLGGRSGRTTDLAGTDLAGTDLAGTDRRGPAATDPISPTVAADDSALDSVLSVWLELNADRDPQITDEVVAESTLLADAHPEVPDWMFAALQASTTDLELGTDGLLDDELQEGSL
jgi:hypothetical protein